MSRQRLLLVAHLPEAAAEFLQAGKIESVDFRMMRGPDHTILLVAH
jgi:hypothetical protein